MTSEEAASFFSDELITFNIFFSKALLSNVDVVVVVEFEVDGTCGVSIALATLSPPGAFFCEVLAALILQFHSLNNFHQNST